MTGRLRQQLRRGMWFAVVTSLIAVLVLIENGSAAATSNADGAMFAACAARGNTESSALNAGLPPACPVAPVLTFVTPLPSGEVGAAYSTQLTFTGGAPPLAWSISGGSLPAGISLSATGLLSGTPTAAGTSSFTVRLSDAQSRATTKVGTLTVIAGPAFTFSAPPSGVIGTAYSQSLTASGGTSPLAWSLPTGSTPPAGLTLSGSTGLLSGTPTTAGTFTFSVKVTDGRAVSDTRSITVVIDKMVSTVAVTTSGSPVTFGSTTTLTATVQPASAAGTIFFDVVPSSGQWAGTHVGLGSAPVVGGVAAVTLTLPAFGANNITATYTGDATHAVVASSIATVEVTGYPGEIIITEFRGSGPDGDNDTYVELYNASATSVPLGGFVVTSSSGMSEPVAYSGASLAPNQSFLLTGGSDFTLRDIATTDQWRTDLGTGGIQVSAPDTAGTQTDAVGPTTDFHRGTGLPAMTGTPTDQYAWVRLSQAGRPRDSGDNAADFMLVSDTGGVVGDVQSTRGSPSPTGMSDPFQHNATLQSTLLDAAVSKALAPNRDYNRATGTLIVRRTITNSSENTIGVARVRLTALSEANGAALFPAGGIPAGGIPPAHASLRVVNPPTATSTMTVGGADVTVQNLGVDSPAGASGGGLNSTLTVPLPEGGLPPGGSIDVAFTFHVDSGGPYWFGYDVDATELPNCAGQGLRTARIRLSC